MLVILLVIGLFSLLVILHEWGHFMAARRGGVEVEEFGVGFPPKVWGKKIKGTLYSINLLPLGGFVRLKGEDGEDKSPGTFAGAKYSTKVKILLAGVGMNLLTALVVLYALCVTGLPGLGFLEPKFLASEYAQAPQLMLSQVAEGSPAAQAGLKRGDLLLATNGSPVTNDEALRAFTKAHAGQEVTLTVQSGDAQRDVKTTLRPATSTEGFLGVGGQEVYKLKYDPLRAVVAAAYITGALFVATIAGVVGLIIQIPNLILGLFSQGVPQAAEAAAGPVGIVYILQSISSLGVAYVFLFIANISVALAAFNVLPLPALDGGRLAFITVQKALKRTIRPETEAKVHAIGFFVLIGLMILISVYDVRKIFLHV